MALDYVSERLNPEFQGLLAAVRQSIRGPAGAYALQARRLAQNASMRPGIRGSGVGLIPQQGLAGAQLGAEAAAEQNLLSQQEAQRFQDEQRAKGEAAAMAQLQYQGNQANEAANRTNRFGYQTAIRNILLGGAPKGILTAGRSIFPSQPRTAGVR